MFLNAGVLLMFLCMTVSVLGASSGFAEKTEEYSKPEIVCPETGPGSEWYQNAPEVTIIHTEPNAVCRYLITAPSGKKTEGELRIEQTEEPDEPGGEEETEQPGETESGGGEETEQPGETESGGEEETEQPMETGPVGEGKTERPDEDGTSESGDEDEPGDESESGADDGTGQEEGMQSDGQGEQEGDHEEKQEPAVAVIGTETWEEGENLLTVWLETEPEGRQMHRQERMIRVDESGPGKVTFSYRDTEGGCFSSSFKVAVAASDTVSGVKEIVCGVGGGKKELIEGSQGILEITPGFEGKITAYAVDRSGRAGVKSESSRICCEDEAPMISLETGTGENVWQQKTAAVRIRVDESGEKYGFASGLKSITYYIGGQAAGRREYSSLEKAVFTDTLEFEADRPSQNGEGVPVMVHVLDRAGNTSVKIKELFVDSEPPVIEIKGIEDSVITGEDVEMEIKVSEENILSECMICICHTAPEEETKEIISLTLEDCDSTGQGVEKDIVLEETGRYECRVTAVDAAGYRTERAVSFTIDRDSPVIRYVDQMNGANIRFFQWNYGKEEMVRDFTEHSYSMYLDREPYFSGEMVTEEGERLLEVRAEDAAGNVSFAKAVFTIDHTPPVMYWGELKDGETYDDSVVLSLWVDGAGEWIRDIDINGEPQKLSADSRIFEYKITEEGTYTVKGEAEDLAGNRKEEEIYFEVRESGDLAGKVIGPVKRIFSGNAEGGSGRSTDMESVSNGSGMRAVTVLAAAGCCAVACAFAAKRLKKKKSP